MNGLRQAAVDAGHVMLVQGPGPMFITAFSPLQAFRDYRDTLTADRAKLGRFVAGMHDAGVRVIGRGLWYISAAHTEQDIDHAVATARKVLAGMD
jgi:glutamate-1-semialdehyde 2,1-aminomutase